MDHDDVGDRLTEARDDAVGRAGYRSTPIPATGLSLPLVDHCGSLRP
jgi:hypothetical protein